MRNKYKITLASLSIITFTIPSLIVVSCGKKKAETINLNSTSSKEEFLDAITRINSGNASEFTFNEIVYRRSEENWTKTLNDFISMWYPSLLKAPETIIETGYLDFESLNSMAILPEIGESFNLDMPKLPKGLHYEFKIDEIFMDKSAAGEDVEYWTTYLPSFKMIETELESIKMKFRVISAFGKQSTLTGKVYEVEFKSEDFTNVEEVFEDESGIINVRVRAHFEKTFKIGSDGKPTSLPPKGTKYVYSLQTNTLSFKDEFPVEWLSKTDRVYYDLRVIDRNDDSITLTDLPKTPTSRVASWSANENGFDCTSIMDSIAGADDYFVNAGDNEKQFKFGNFITPLFKKNGTEDEYSTTYPTGLINGDKVDVKLTSANTKLIGVIEKTILVNGVRNKVDYGPFFRNVRLKISDGQFYDDKDNLISLPAGYKMQYRGNANNLSSNWVDAPIYKSEGVGSYFAVRLTALDQGVNEAILQAATFMQKYGKDENGNPLWSNTDADYNNYIYVNGLYQGQICFWVSWSQTVNWPTRPQ